VRIETFTVGVFQVNTYLLVDEPTGEAAIVDTGESDELVRRLRAAHPNLAPRYLLLTHTHLDHAGALPLLQAAYPDAITIMPADDRPLFETLPMQGSMFGMPHLDRPCGRIDREVRDGDAVQLGQTTLRFFATPGHTPGQGCWFDDTDIFVGDTLFAGSIGRTDFPLSDPAQAVASLRRLLQLPGHLRVHSGHGPVTTLERELRTNPFLGYLRRERGIAAPPGTPDIRWAPGTGNPA
jgi:hydroxyacylglutathione hydrolase